MPGKELRSNKQTKHKRFFLFALVIHTRALEASTGFRSPVRFRVARIAREFVFLLQLGENGKVILHNDAMIVNCIFLPHALQAGKGKS